VKFSVIIPTYNRADLLRRCLESLQEQTFKNFEVLVCDDGSIDHTAEVIQEFSSRLDIHYFHGPNWGGPAHPRNVGLRNAKGAWIAFLDADDYWSANKLEAVNEVLESGDVIYHALKIVNEKNIVLGNIPSSKIPSPVFENMLKSGNKIPLSSVVCKKELVLKAEGFAEEKKLIAVEDFDLWLRLSRVGVKFFYLPQYLGFYHVGGDNISQTSLAQLKRTRAIYLKHLPFVNNKHDKNLIIGSYLYQKYRMLNILKGRSGSRGSLKLTFKYSSWSQKAKAFIVYLRAKN
jgi:glycosyltransferase involved in cell wall biosynthesis